MADSADVHLATNYRMTDGVSPALGREILRVGDEIDVPFASVRAASLAPDGRLAVLDSRLDRLFVFGETGELEYALGQSGDGPGEFRQPVSFAWNGSIRVFDLRSSRVTTWDDPAAEPAARMVEGPMGRVAALTFVNDSLRVTQHASIDEALETAEVPGRVRQVGTIRLENLRRGTGRELFRGPLNEFIALSKSMIVDPPMGHSMQVATSSDHIFVASTEDLEILRFDLTGRLTGRIRNPWATRPVTDQELDSLRERHRRLAAMEGAPDGFVEIFDRRYQPDTRPAFSTFRVSRDGWFWIGSYAGNREPSTVWHLVNPEGRWVADLDLPAGSDVLDVTHDAVVLKITDDLGVQQVAVWSLQWPIQQE